MNLTALLKNNVGRLRIMGFLEGTSLLVLLFIAMPMKYYFDDPSLVKSIGPIHGLLFTVFMIFAVIVAIQKKWKFFTLVIVFLSCFIPFGTFYVDHKIFKHL